MTEAYIVLRWRPLFRGQHRQGLPQEFAVPIGGEFPTEEAAHEYIFNLPPIEGRFTIQRVLPARPDPHANRLKSRQEARSGEASYQVASEPIFDEDGLV
jgi:hypothetical protein